jgi:Mn-dependent DtxR family transcriptional regulator
MGEHEFFTFREYMKKDQDTLSASAEDYVEMIYRLSRKSGFTRTNDLASALNVQPPSVTKMVQKLSDLKLIKYEKYGVIMLEDNGLKIGEMLLMRHNIIEEFLSLFNITNNLLEETEKIEHTVNNEILLGMKDLTVFFSENPDILEKFNKYRDGKNKL